MDNILELLYDIPHSPFVRTARIKSENMEMLNATMTDEQKELLETVRKIESEERYLMEKMSLDDCQHFQTYANLHSRLSSAGEENLFSYSFTLGLLLALDVMEEATLLTGE